MFSSSRLYISEFLLVFMSLKTTRQKIVTGTVLMKSKHVKKYQIPKLFIVCS